MHTSTKKEIEKYISENKDKTVIFPGTIAFIFGITYDEAKELLKEFNAKNKQETE